MRDKKLPALIELCKIWNPILELTCDVTTQAAQLERGRHHQQTLTSPQNPARLTTFTHHHPRKNATRRRHGAKCTVVGRWYRLEVIVAEATHSGFARVAITARRGNSNIDGGRPLTAVGG